MTFAVALPHPSLVTCKNHGPAPPHELGEWCFDPKPAEVRIEVGPCETCDGSGLTNPQFQVRKPCPTCNGSGDNEGRAKLRVALVSYLDKRQPVEAIFAAIEGMA